MKIIQDYNDTELQNVIEITDAMYVDEYVIRVSFNDGSEQLVNFKPFLTKSLHPSISKYLDTVLFSQFKITNGNLNWNDYDLIFPIHNLYEGKID